MKKQLLIFILLLNFPVFADDCLQYKLNPNINIKNPEWSKEVIQPLKPMNLLHGNVSATFVENYELIVDTARTEDGICVSLKALDATVGYNNFMVQIDSRHVPNSCGYNATLAHEDEHIRTYLSVIDDNKDDVKNSVYSAANSIIPVFVKNDGDIDSAIDELNNKLQAHPDLILMKQKIQAEEEIRNKQVDIQDPGLRIKKCLKDN